MNRLGFVYIDGYEFAVDTSDAPSSRRAPESPMPVERAGTPQVSERRGVRSA